MESIVPRVGWSVRGVSLSLRGSVSSCVRESTGVRDVPPDEVREEGSRGRRTLKGLLFFALGQTHQLQLRVSQVLPKRVVYRDTDPYRTRGSEYRVQ